MEHLLLHHHVLRQPLAQVVLQRERRLPTSGGQHQHTRGPNVVGNLSTAPLNSNNTVCAAGALLQAPETHNRSVDLRWGRVDRSHAAAA